MESYSHVEILNGFFVVNTLASIAFFVQCLPLLSNTSDAVAALESGILFLGFIPLSYYCLRIYPTRLNIGAIAGGSLVMTMIALQTSIFWGQHASCKWNTIAHTDTSELRYERFFMDTFAAAEDARISLQCNGKASGAMKRLCGLSVFLFLQYIAFVGVLSYYLDEMMRISVDYSLVATTSHPTEDADVPAMPSENESQSSNPALEQTSVDL